MMKKRILSLAFVAVAATAFAQSTTTSTAGKVGINTDAPKETLEVSGTMKVVDLPTAGANKIYNGAATKTGTFTPTKQVVADANGVLGAREFEKKWFYMPSIVLPLTAADITSHPYVANITKVAEQAEAVTVSLDLYEIYKKQFGTPAYKTTSTETLKLYTKDELDFFVIYYDNKVFENVQFTADKKLQYTVTAAANVTEHTFMNIVFKVK